MRRHRSPLIACGAAIAALAVIAAVPLGHRVTAAMTALAGGSPNWLTLAAAGFAVAFLCTVGAWRAAFAAAGGRIRSHEAAARIGIGCLVNAVAPAKLGDAVKVALCSRAIDGPRSLWTGGGVWAALAAARSLALAALVVVASLAGALPLWPVFVLCGVAAAVAVAAHGSRRFRSHARIAQLLEGMAAFARSPRTAFTVVAWSMGVQLVQLLATIAVARGLGVPHPVLAALVITPALELAGAFPITPGSFGVGSGAVAFALASRGIGITQALAVGLAIQTLQTAVSLTAGTVGALYLARLNVAVRRLALRVALVGGTAAFAAAVGVAFVNLT